MAFSTVGIEEIVMCKKGTLLSTPTGKLPIGIKNPATLTFEPAEPIEDFRGRKYNNLIKSKIEAESLQANFEHLKTIYDDYFTDNGADVQLLTANQSSGSPNCFQFADNNCMGIDFNFTWSSKKRSILYTLENSLPFETVRGIVDNADNATPVDFSSINPKGDLTLVRHPFATEIDSLTLDEVIDYDFSIKTVGEKNIYGRTIIDYLQIDCTVTLNGASIPDIVAELNTSPYISFLIRNEITGVGKNLYERVLINSGVVTLQSTIEIGDKSRTVKLVYSGKVPKWNLSFSNSVADGGNGTDYKAGTMTITA